MSTQDVAGFLDYWENEGAIYAQRGDYAWMASLVPGNRVLEIGCGPGFGTSALLERGLAVLVVDNLPACLNAVSARAGAAQRVQADICNLDEAARQHIAEFAPETVVCWFMGAPAEATGANGRDGGKAVVSYRETVHRAVAELAASLESVNVLHLVDRTVIPWQAKDIGRDTLVNYHLGKTLRDLPFSADRRDALYRKLELAAVDMLNTQKMHPSLKGAVPTLASLLAKRSQ